MEYRLGSLCAIDTVPHEEFDIKSKQILLDLASCVANEIKLRVNFNSDVASVRTFPVY